MAGAIATHMAEDVSGQPLPRKTVMIVEDNELNMRLFRDLLTAFGYRTVETRDGLQALDLARSEMTVNGITP